MKNGFLYAAALFAAITMVEAQEMNRAQSGSAAKPKFEVASVRECEPKKEQPPPSLSTAGRLRLGCWPLSVLISDAYETFASGQVDPLKPPKAPPLEGTPSWANTTSYTIDAEAEGAPSGAMMRGPMMQTLLEDRFQVKVHRETREISGYVMTVDKGALKLKPAQAGSCDHIDPTDPAQAPPATPCNVPLMSNNGPLRVFDLRGVTLDVFAQFLRPDGRPVINQTGLTGVFDIHLEWEPNPGNSADAENGAASAPPPRMTQIEEMRRQLGLRLDPGKGRRELLVLDRVEKPSSN